MKLDTTSTSEAGEVMEETTKGNARSSGYNRVDVDWYVEPRRAIDELLDVEQFEGAIWDPACGGGNIVKACIVRGLSAHGSDIVNRGYGFQVDFFSVPTDTERVANIITNPPFKHGVTFTSRALDLAFRKVCILQRTAWLEGEMRYHHLFATGKLARVWQFRKRISMPPGGRDIPARNGSVAFAWYVFDHEHSGPPTLGWLP